MFPTYLLCRLQIKLSLNCCMNTYLLGFANHREPICPYTLAVELQTLVEWGRCGSPRECAGDLESVAGPFHHDFEGKAAMTHLLQDGCKLGTSPCLAFIFC